jgi:hypothetical protein
LPPIFKHAETRARHYSGVVSGPIAPRQHARSIAQHDEPARMLHDRAPVERTRVVEPIVTVEHALQPPSLPGLNNSIVYLPADPMRDGNRIHGEPTGSPLVR